MLTIVVSQIGQINLGALGNLGNLGKLLGGLGGQRKNIAANVFKKILAHGDWWDSSLEDGANYILCKAGVWAVIGRYKVPAQQAYRFGFGSAAFPDNQGYLFVAIYDDTATNSAKEEGALRLVQRNAQGTLHLVVAEFRTEQLSGDVSDRSKQIALPEQTQFPLVGEDSYLELQVKLDAADGIVKTAIGTAAGLDIWNIPVTVYQ